jgi:alpha-amylase/alpha-mannosidase (GH57 family)
MTRVALLWHMHQPFYEDLATGEHILPWVRLHALKDYWGMAALLREFPDVKVTFNLVPSLLVQLEAFARDEARDRHLDLSLKPADALSADERAFCIENFFHAHRPRMIDPFPRYAELIRQRGDGSALSARALAPQFSVDDLRDLQVWHKLAWIDAYYWDRDPRVQALVAKGRGFSEEDKRTLRVIELELLRQVVPEYRDGAARGQIEISSSPFYHPILPLLCDTDIYLRTHPDSRMPRERFSHPDDATEQLVRAAALHERLFGRRPDGLWPSEGSVSDAMVPLVARAGYRWMATDEEILARTLGRHFSRDVHGHLEQPELLYKPYVVDVGGETVACGFRDHTLSDLIGFTYASWPADAAADDFVRRLEEAGARYRSRSGGEEATVFVILDGENAWEHYEGQGRPFLRALYGRLAASTSLQTVTMSEACAGARDVLSSVFPGSWINADFYIWIGHQDDQRAWSQLADARRALDRHAADVPAAALARAREELFIAEGSDWFWWYGDDHSSDHDLEFDDLFRRHVRNVYRALDRPVPEELFVTNISSQPAIVAILPPTGFIHPVIDGEVSSYFEWIGAGCVEAPAVAGAMHRVAEHGPGIALVEFGFDLENLYLRVDGRSPMRSLMRQGLDVAVKFLQPAGTQVTIRLDQAGTGAAVTVRGGQSAPRSGADAGITAAIGSVLEVRIPFGSLGLGTGAPVAFMVALNDGAVEIEHHPQIRPVELEVPDSHFGAKNWTA